MLPQRHEPDTFSQTSPGFYVSAIQILKKKRKKKPVGNGEFARNEQFLYFPPVFSSGSENLPPFSSCLKLLSASTLNLEQSLICRLGKG